ncbi:O-antigen ligase family protein [Hungatella hathewayi]|uniref:O-antigen ligase family protein n=1 Tax=Hungatella hathewayi TaxID=154046 RepID=UPI003564DAAD
MNIKKTTLANRKVHSISLHAVPLCILTCLSFVFHFISAVFGVRIYIVLVVVAVFFSVISKGLKLYKPTGVSYFWFLSGLIIVLEYIRSSRQMNTLTDVLVLLAGIILVTFYPRNSSGYIKSIELMAAFAMFFSVGVFLQRFFPLLYKPILSLFPAVFSVSVSRISSNYVTGFSTNPGFTAGYICAGIIALLSLRERMTKSKLYVLLITFAVTLLFTGKRGHVAFIVLTVIFCSLLPERKNKKMKRFWNWFLVLLVSVVAVMIFRDILMTIPGISRIIETFEEVVSGKDVDSVRTRLSMWAFHLFLSKPLMGIGWGDYRNTVVGNATVAAALDTHNIYMQLLCETGIVGFLLIVTAMLTFWILTSKSYIECVRNGISGVWKCILHFAFLYQTYFLMMGLSANVLYDQHYQIIYFISCAAFLAFRRFKYSNDLVKEKGSKLL